jgi:hypothetical protein
MIATRAIISRIWMILPALNAKNPTAQAITSITAIKYNRFPMIFFLY